MMLIYSHKPLLTEQINIIARMLLVWVEQMIEMCFDYTRLSIQQAICIKERHREFIKSLSGITKDSN